MGGTTTNGGSAGTTSHGGVPSGAAGEGGAPEPNFGGAGADAGGAGAAGAGGRPPITGLIAAYPCEGASNAQLPDASGNGKHASLANGNGGSLSGFGFGAGVVGKALSLSPNAQAYVRLPPGIVSGLTEVTVATWIKVNSSSAFQRIFDFGLDTSNFMYLASAGSTGLIRFRIASASVNKNQVLEGGKALPLGKWSHVALTLGDGGVSIYLDGLQIAQQAPVVLRPADLGNTGNNFVGRSPFAADPYLDAQVDEFQIYSRALTATEIGYLAERP